jgi:hypothetical protein
VRRIVHPLELAKVNETHLVFTATEFSTWDNRISQLLSRQGVDPLAPIDVETLRHAVNPPEAGRGLSDPVRDLVVAAWASRHRRACTGTACRWTNPARSGRSGPTCS